jgi:hypothetical protein
MQGNLLVAFLEGCSQVTGSGYSSIIIYWNKKYLGHIVSNMQKKGNHIPQEALSHLSPLGWEHIILTGHYKW